MKKIVLFSIVARFRLLVFLSLPIILGACSSSKTEEPAFRKFSEQIAFQSNPSSEKKPEVVRLKAGVIGFVKRDRPVKNHGLYLTEEFDPAKTPVLLVHGLLSDPTAWDKMVALLKEDPQIHEQFQFWYYSYPTSIPTVPSAAMFRRHLDAAVEMVEQNYSYSMKRKLIVVGHSMGGILSKSLISDSKNLLWDAAFKVPASELELTKAQRKLVSEAFMFEHRDYVKAAIFIATPHRGSGLASNFVGKVGTAFVSRPEVIEDLAKALAKQPDDKIQPAFKDFVSHKVNSISTLRSNSPITQMLADLPTDSEVIFHTISGVKGQRQGDGVVPVSSTFVAKARCECFIESGHNVHEKELAINLVKRLIGHEKNLVNQSEIVEFIKENNFLKARLGRSIIH